MKANTHFIVINGFSADAIEILAQNFNSFSKRNRIVRHRPWVSIGNPAGIEEKEGEIYKSVRVIIKDICTFLGSIPEGRMTYTKEAGGKFLNDALRLLTHHPEAFSVESYVDAVQEVVVAFNKKARMFKLSSRLQFTEK